MQKKNRAWISSIFTEHDLLIKDLFYGIKNAISEKNSAILPVQVADHSALTARFTLSCLLAEHVMGHADKKFRFSSGRGSFDVLLGQNLFHLPVSSYMYPLENET